MTHMNNVFSWIRRKYLRRKDPDFLWCMHRTCSTCAHVLLVLQLVSVEAQSSLEMTYDDIVSGKREKVRLRNRNQRFY